MTPDTWQLLIAVFALADAIYLARKARRTAQRVIWAAVLPRLFFGAWSLFDALWTRNTMEPGRTITYMCILLLFVTANVSHVAEWRNRK